MLNYPERPLTEMHEQCMFCVCFRHLHVLNSHFRIYNDFILKQTLISYQNVAKFVMTI